MKYLVVDRNKPLCFTEHFQKLRHVMFFGILMFLRSRPPPLCPLTRTSTRDGDPASVPRLAAALPTQ